jgi:hypothetical protein
MLSRALSNDFLSSSFYMYSTRYVMIATSTLDSDLQASFQPSILITDMARFTNLPDGLVLRVLDYITTMGQLTIVFLQSMHCVLPLGQCHSAISLSITRSALAQTRRHLDFYDASCPHTSIQSQAPILGAQSRSFLLDFVGHASLSSTLTKYVQVRVARFAFDTKQ